MEPHLIDDLAYKERFYWWHRVRRDNLLRLLGPTHGGCSRVLEMGSGTGANLRALRDRFDQTIGLDIDFKALGYCRDLTTIRADALDKLTFADGVFYAIILLDVLEHISDTTVLVSKLPGCCAREEQFWSWRWRAPSCGATGTRCTAITDDTPRKCWLAPSTGVERCASWSIFFLGCIPWSGAFGW